MTSICHYVYYCQHKLGWSHTMHIPYFTSSQEGVCKVFLTICIQPPRWRGVIYIPILNQETAETFFTKVYDSHPKQFSAVQLLVIWFDSNFLKKWELFA